tara:strand:+ start:16107 stop:16814 length:708 start_codon:yes stop_codon:yes gene_type:complete
MTDEQMAQIGDYVLGLLEGSELNAFEARLKQDPALARAVGLMQAQLQSLDDTAAALPASPELWTSIERDLDKAPLETAGTVVPFFRRSRPMPAAWFGLAASVAVAMGIGYFAGTLGGSSPRQPVMVAVLLGDSDAGPGAIVEAFADDTIRLLPLERFAVPEGKILQVWTLPDADTGPVSLGTLTDQGAVTLAGPDLPLPSSGQLYEITLEPAPGSPTGRPTGPVLVKGFAKAPLI